MKTFCVKYRKYTDKYTENIHDMAYGKSKDLAKKLNQNFFFRYNAFKIASDRKYDAYKRGLASMVYKFLIKSLAEVVLMLNQIMNSRVNFINRLLKNLRDEKKINRLRTILGR